MMKKVYDLRPIIVDKAFNSKMETFHQSTNINEMLDIMFEHIKKQTENPKLADSEFKIKEILYTHISFNKLSLFSGSSYLPLPEWLALKKAIINPKNENDQECFKWAIIAGLHYKEIGKNPQRISNLRKFEDQYNWSGLKFPLSIDQIKKFEKNNPNIAVNVFYIVQNKEEVNILQTSNYKAKRSKEVNLLLITEDELNHYVAITSLSRLLSSMKNNHQHKLYFCINCMNSFNTEEKRDNHVEYCRDHDSVKIKMPNEKNKWLKFKDGYKQFKVPFVMYFDTECILEKMSKIPHHDNNNKAYTRKINKHIPCGFAVYSKFAYGDVLNH